jgi:hypothetical protein
MDPRVFGFRVIINWLVSRGADFSSQDINGQTPLHLAANEGWGENLDVFLTCEGEQSERRQMFCLSVTDNGGATLLDHALMTGIKGALNGGAHIVKGEMLKRSMLISHEPPDIIEKRYRERLVIHWQQFEHEPAIRRNAARPPPSASHPNTGGWNPTPSPPASQRSRLSSTQASPTQLQPSQPMTSGASRQANSYYSPPSSRPTQPSTSNFSPINRQVPSSTYNPPAPVRSHNRSSSPPSVPGRLPVQPQPQQIPRAVSYTQQQLTPRPANIPLQTSPTSPGQQQKTLSTSKLMKRFMKKS